MVPCKPAYAGTGARTPPPRRVNREDPAAADIARIEPRSGLQPLHLAELWRYRGLLYCFARRDLRLRYRQTLAGVAWVAMQPLLSALIFTVFFGHWLRVSSSGAPYVLFVFCGIVPWSYFVHVMTVSTNSVVSQRALVTKVWFPRITIPFSSALAGLVDLGISLLFLVGLMCYHQVIPHLSLLAVPIFVAMAVMTAVAVGLWLSALDVWYRDVAQALPFFSQLWFFATPVAYSSDVVPPAWRWLYDLNPMVGVVDGLRWSILGTGTLDLFALATSSTAMLLILVGGLYFYRAREAEFADVI
jgi:lipopolysaccharide transport system permease protein